MRCLLVRVSRGVSSIEWTPRARNHAPYSHGRMVTGDISPQRQSHKRFPYIMKKKQIIPVNHDGFRMISSWVFHHVLATPMWCVAHAYRTIGFMIPRFSDRLVSAWNICLRFLLETGSTLYLSRIWRRLLPCAVHVLPCCPWTFYRRTQSSPLHQQSACS